MGGIYHLGIQVAAIGGQQHLPCEFKVPGVDSACV